MSHAGAGCIEQVPAPAGAVEALDHGAAVEAAEMARAVEGQLRRYGQLSDHRRRGNAWPWRLLTSRKERALSDGGRRPIEVYRGSACSMFPRPKACQHTQPPKFSPPLKHPSEHVLVLGASEADHRRAHNDTNKRALALQHRDGLDATNIVLYHPSYNSLQN